jgi:hypothetical protein
MDIETTFTMKTARTFFLMVALVGFLFSFIIHLLVLSGRVPTSEFWDMVAFLGAFVLFVSAAYLSGTKAVRMGLIPISAIVKDCPTWLKRTEYFFFAYLGLICVWVALRPPGIFHWRKVELPARTGFVIFSAVAMSFYISSFSMLFGKLFGERRRDTASSDGVMT